jgi:hypothetical protein
MTDEPLEERLKSKLEEIERAAWPFDLKYKDQIKEFNVKFKDFVEVLEQDRKDGSVTYTPSYISELFTNLSLLRMFVRGEKIAFQPIVIQKMEYLEDAIGLKQEGDFTRIEEYLKDNSMYVTENNVAAVAASVSEENRDVKAGDIENFRKVLERWGQNDKEWEINTVPLSFALHRLHEFIRTEEDRIDRIETAIDTFSDFNKEVDALELDPKKNTAQIYELAKGYASSMKILDEDVVALFNRIPFKCMLTYKNVKTLGLLWSAMLNQNRIPVPDVKMESPEFWQYNCDGNRGSEDITLQDRISFRGEGFAWKWTNRSSGASDLKNKIFRGEKGDVFHALDNGDDKIANFSLESGKRIASSRINCSLGYLWLEGVIGKTLIIANNTTSKIDHRQYLGINSDSLEVLWSYDIPKDWDVSVTGDSVLVLHKSRVGFVKMAQVNRINPATGEIKALKCLPSIRAKKTEFFDEHQGNIYLKYESDSRVFIIDAGSGKKKAVFEGFEKMIYCNDLGKYSGDGFVCLFDDVGDIPYRVTVIDSENLQIVRRLEEHHFKMIGHRQNIIRASHNPYGISFHNWKTGKKNSEIKAKDMIYIQGPLIDGKLFGNEYRGKEIAVIDLEKKEIEYFDVGLDCADKVVGVYKGVVCMKHERKNRLVDFVLYDMEAKKRIGVLSTGIKDPEIVFNDENGMMCIQAGSDRSLYGIQIEK